MVHAIHDAFVETASKMPRACALSMGDERWTYGAVDFESNRLSRIIGQSGCEPGDRVGLFMPKTPMSVISLLAIYKAGCICVPLDVTNPVDRIGKMLAACDCNCLIAAGIPASKLDRVALLKRVIWIDQENRYANATFEYVDIATQPAEPLQVAKIPDIAHILFTSGSTGTPKAVPVLHQSIEAFVRWAIAFFHIVPGDRIAGQTPLHFDLSLFDIFGALCSGAEIRLLSSTLSIDPSALIAEVGGAGVTHWLSVPSLFSYIARFDALAENPLPALREVMWCGEVIPTPTLIYWMRHLRAAAFTNLYGPTEACIASSYYRVKECPTDSHEDIPIGEACPGEELLLLDEGGNPITPGEVGELYIGGMGVCPGYWQDEALSKGAFIAHGSTGKRLYKTGDLARRGDDGLIHFVGRRDSQIKSRGYRIELGEVERAILAFDYVKECAVVPVPDSLLGGTGIACAFVDDGSGQTALGITRDLREVLPNYMIPTRWLDFEDLPRNRNGKIDRVKLKNIFADQESMDKQDQHYGGSART